MFIQIVEIYHLLDSGTPPLGEKNRFVTTHAHLLRGKTMLFEI
jgi:hypothetical protein